MIDIDELERLEKDATMAPWTNRMQDGICNKYIEEDAIVISKEERDNMTRSNIALIVAARNSLPGLIAEVRAAREWWAADTHGRKYETDVAREAYRKAIEANGG